MTPIIQKKPPCPRCGAGIGGERKGAGCRAQPGHLMNNEDMRQALHATLDLPKDILQQKHPTTAAYGTHLVDYTPDGTMIAEYPIRQQDCNCFGTLQGGFLCALIDDSVGMFLLAASGGSQFYTIDLHTCYHRPIPQDISAIQIRTRVRSAGRRIVCMESQVLDRDGRLFATSVSNLCNVSGVSLRL